ncbi:uncharacterized protein Tco025E_02258 [Trypanosoma conorhini]|uniref:Uncharacterized protein n=1 Tax=Trypanosoma conorhini TaxID=83891 RepID=A0A3R7LJ14_9TRYP|nr:uncharacterized protein Tco025E_02258 [Trypanosoma conorhini]RNF25578.1 hypothetical protein Tco025E_02258 [Trypanosoma conorhini]
MLFSLDGLLVKGEAGPLLSVAEGQQLVALYRLFHRLHHSQPARGAGVAHAVAPQRASFPAFLRPVVAHSAAAAAAESGGNGNADALDCIGEASGHEKEGLVGGGGGGGGSHDVTNGAEFVTAPCGNTNRAANGMEEAQLRTPLSSCGAAGTSRGRSGGAVEAVALQICTSRRKLFCVQRLVPETGDAVFFCGGVGAHAAQAPPCAGRPRSM